MPAKSGAKDWRPDLYTVKKGDTLYSIGLEHGYDYKEIARANNIAPPYTIFVGQKLKLKPGSPAPAPVAEAGSGDVVITPLDMGSVDSSVIESSSTETAASSEQAMPATTAAPIISGPIALREPYSDLALNTPVVEAKAAPVNVPAPSPTTAPAPAQVSQEASPPSAADPVKTEAIKAPTATATSAGITWSWPTNGKLLAGFNEGGSAKGIDIGGSTGQPILASAPGKVIYSGSDLRGYGRLVIIKHNDEFLSVYAHNSKILVKEGQAVARGQKIAEMGNTDADRVKLHFEIRRQGKSVNPADFLPANPG
ncbi:MAG: peptidase M23 [Betaproteobacteria bacterium HGW-Betaproteobacteria-1]|jgi:lipoprotein NlpD|nr:MAG: peptidase M23 [Betaproteobacteria bacterium HGW-Betaproteobacteria-1]